MQLDAGPSECWNLDARPAVSDVDHLVDSDDDASLASHGSMITLDTPSTPAATIVLNREASTASTPNATLNPIATVTPSSPARTRRGDVLMETPEKDRKLNRKKPDDCHVIIRWSHLVRLVKDNFVCACG
jgi:hypothetical protein